MSAALYWLTALAALLGVVLNIRKHVASFWIWSGTNAVWAWADFQHGLVAQGALQSVYFALSLWGIWKWSARGNGARHGAEDPR